VEASSDLVDWSQIGTATPGVNGNYDFDDTLPAGAPSRYYRVVTQ
jgi:hypothetical protein